MISRFAVAASLALALAACGSSNEPTSTSTETVTSTTAATPEAVPAEAAPSAAPSTEAATPEPHSHAQRHADGQGQRERLVEDERCGDRRRRLHAHGVQPVHRVPLDPGRQDHHRPLARARLRTQGRHPAGFQYSQAMKDSGLTWNSATLDRYLTDPKSVVPGTLMGFAGLKDEEQREAVIRYLKTL